MEDVALVSLLGTLGMCCAVVVVVVKLAIVLASQQEQVGLGPFGLLTLGATDWPFGLV